MKKKPSCTYLLLGLTLSVVLVCVVCSSLQKATLPPDSTLPSDSTSPPDSLICWEQTRSSRPQPGMINTINGLAADGDLLWIATDRGLARLDLRTWTCDLFTEAAGVSLVGSILLLPDGAGGLWASEWFHYDESSLGLLFYSEGAWQGTRLNWSSVDALALNQTGQICVYGMVSKRTPAQVCAKGNTFPPDWDKRVAPPQDSLADCDLWQRASAHYGYRSFYYPSSAGCELLKENMERKSWCLFALADEKEVWIADCEPSDDADTILLHREGETVEEIKGVFPRYGVEALAPDPVRGGLWIGTSEGLVYAEITATGDYVFQPIPLLLGGTSAQGDRYVSVSQPFPGDAAGLPPGRVIHNGNRWCRRWMALSCSASYPWCRTPKGAPGLGVRIRSSCGRKNENATTQDDTANSRSCHLRRIGRACDRV